MQNKTALERLGDWDALCDWLEDRPYNASYEPKCRGAYLLNTPYSPIRTIQVDDPEQPPLVLHGGSTIIPRKKTIPNPKLAEEKSIAKWTRKITKERQRLGLVYWASGYGWRLRKDYREKIAAERERLMAETQADHPRANGRDTMLDQYLKDLCREYLALCDLMTSHHYHSEDERNALSAQRTWCHNELIRLLGDEYERPFDMKAYARERIAD